MQVGKAAPDLAHQRRKAHLQSWQELQVAALQAPLVHGHPVPAVSLQPHIPLVMPGGVGALGGPAGAGAGMALVRAPTPAQGVN